MHLISPLAAGIVGAENGTARVYRRGTSTRATIYPDFEASSSDSSGSDIQLDSRASAVRYVNELVQVQVYDSTGQLVRDFVAGEQAYAVEVISAAFAGTDYVSGQQAVSKPTTAGAVFDLWQTSAGAPDWKGLYSGSATLLQNIFGALYGLFYNVKSPEFGAIGDGSTDDAAAIQAAHDAASAAGGGIVVFPPGTYNIGAELIWDAGVSAIGVPGTVFIRITAAANSCIRITGIANAFANYTPTILFGLSFSASVATTATQLSIAHGDVNEAHVIGCNFNISSNCQGTCISLGGTNSWQTKIRHCRLQTHDEFGILVYDTSSAGAGCVTLEGCQLYTRSAAAHSQTLVQSAANDLRIHDCDFYFQSTSGTSVGVGISSTSKTLTVSASRFRYVTGSATNYGVTILAGGRINVDDACEFNFATKYQHAATACLANGYRLQTTPFVEQEVAATTVTLPDWVDSFFLKFTSTQPTITMPTIGFVGQEVDIIVLNQSGGAWAGPFSFAAAAGTNTSYRLTLPNLANLDKFSIRFRAIHQPGSATEEWQQIGEWVTW